VTLYEELLQRKKSTNELVLNAASFFRSEFPKNLASSLKCHQNKINYNIGSPTISDFEVKFSITAHVRVTDSNAIDFILNLPSFTYTFSTNDDGNNAQVFFDGVNYRLEDEMFFQDLVLKAADNELVKIKLAEDK